MRKRVFVTLAAAVFLILVCFAIVGCDNIDRSGFPEGYVEVSQLRVKSANVYLSPNGDTSTYQLEVEVLPKNANQALTYYVPSQYLQYVTVSSTGLITAKELTPEGVIIPLKVTSTTNKNATLTINVTVTEVEVDRLFFSPASITLDYNGESVQLNPQFEPYHAQDGRTLTYTSSDNKICTVNADGIVTPVGAGHAYVYAVGQTLAGREIRAEVPVFVKYTEGAGQYRLDVSDNAPAYNQIVGEEKSINFNLVKLNEHLNPNVSILWYVDASRQEANDGQWQFKYTPTDKHKTSYKVSVHILVNDEPEIVLYSHEITIYDPFAGYDLVFANMSSARDAYQYGAEKTFALTSGQDAIERYAWYLKRLGESTDGQLIAETLPTDRDLTKKMNVEGDYVLTAYGLSSERTRLSQKEFEFSVTRFVVGDTLIIEPTLRSDGLPPESYDYYLVTCASDGTPTASARYIGNTPAGERFLYPLENEGYFKIVSRAIQGGVIAKVGGEEFSVETEVLHVYDGVTEDIPTAESLVQAGSRYLSKNVVYVPQPTISGVRSSGVNAVVRWTATAGVPSYVVEVKKSDGSVYLLDSDGAEKSAFSNDYVVLPTSIVTLDDAFSVRVKQKGGLYSRAYYYGYERIPEGEESFYTAKITSDCYSYLTPFTGVTNGYLTSVADLGRILSYVVLNNPQSNDVVVKGSRRIDGVNYNAYTVSVYPAFDYVTAADDYPAVLDESISDDDEAIYCVTLGAQNAYAPTGYYRYAFEKQSDGGYRITVMVPDVGNTLVVSDPIEKQTTLSPNYSSTPYGVSNASFVVDTRKKPQVRVSDSEQLYYALANGDSVIRANDAMVNLYSKILAVVNKVIDADMTDGEKALAFYDWLTSNVVYDSDLADTEVETDAATYAGFRLEGVFHYGQAVCDGISKAYVVLCAIEGIPCVRVAGEVNEAAHAWNKVFIDGKWVVVDATNGCLFEDGKLYSTHAFFGLTDEAYAILLNDVREIGDYPDASEGIDYYAGTINGCPVTIATQEQLNDLINSFGKVADDTAIELKFDTHFADTPAAILAAVQAVENTGPNDVSDTVVYLTNNRAIITLH